MSDAMSIANSPAIWVCSAVIVSVVVVQSYLYMRLAKKNAQHMGISEADCKLAFRTGVVSSLGPAIACFVALVGLMATIGGPIAWQRLAIIGAAPTELAAVNAVTTAAGMQGVQLSDPNFSLSVLAATWWAMALNGCGWLIVTALFADKLEGIREKIGGGDSAWLGALSAAAMIGIFSYLTLNTIVAKLTFHLPQACAAFGSMVAMFACIKLSAKSPRLREYGLGIAIIVGLIAGSLAL